MNNFTTIHRNEMFLPWHRIFVKEFEELVQNIRPELSIPSVGNLLAKQRGDSEEEPLFEKESTPATYSLSQKLSKPI